MKTPEKIATCCYCGTRAALVLSGTSRHELACSACGAPLHDLKMLKKGHARAEERELIRPSRLRGTSKPKKSKKKRKSFGQRLLGEAFDLLDDILD